MAIFPKAAAALALASLVAACAISPGPETPSTAFCGFDRYLLEVETPDGAPGALGAQPQYDRSMSEALAEAYQTESVDPAISPSMLFLSGGGENGAFGAGYLDQWARMRSEGLPRLKVVTGISTGAIMATFAFIGDTKTIVDNYRITREEEVLDPYVEGGGELSLWTGLTVLQRGAVADLDPLRDRLRNELTDDVFRKVAEAYRDERRLYVGVVDVDTGRAVALDMTAMAALYDAARAAGDDARQNRIRDCYADAIIASSSVPLAAPPAFIDNRMYIDGGARFGVFSDELGDFINERQQVVAGRRIAGPFLYVIVNGDLQVDADCGKIDQTICDADPWALEGARRDWRFTELAGRSVAILIDQVYLNSVARIIDRAEATGDEALVAFIRADMPAHQSAVDPVLGQGQKSCAEWLAEDERFDRPVEFHPRFMHCLVDYGMARARAESWAVRE